MNMLVTSQYQPRLSSITKIFSKRISQSDCSIQVKLNYKENKFNSAKFNFCLANKHFTHEKIQVKKNNKKIQ